MDDVTAPQRVLLTGATGAIGGRLLPLLRAAGHDVTCLVRDPGRARLPAGVRVVRGDVLSGAGLAEALDGAQVAYYLIHSMGRGARGDFAANDRRGAMTFAAAARDAGLQRVVYLGGLPAPGPGSAHLRSREEVARILADAAPVSVHARAAMVIGAGQRVVPDAASARPAPPRDGRPEVDRHAHAADRAQRRHRRARAARDVPGPARATSSSAAPTSSPTAR